jgi:hypothetical protein
MSHRIRTHLRTNIVGYIALFCFAMSGSAMALNGSNTVFSDDIVNGEVKNPDIATNAVHSDQILNSGVENQDLLNNAINSSKLAANAVIGSKLAPDSVNSSKVLDNSLTADDLGTQSVGSDELAGTGFGNNGFNGDEEIIDGTISGFDIAGSTLSGFHIADGTLTNADLADEPSAGSGSNAAVISVPAGGVEVVSAPITTNGTGRILIDASAELQGDDADERAQCSVRLDGSTVGLFYESTFDDIGTGNEATVSVNSAATGVPAGAHTVSMFCSALSGTIIKDDAGINATGITG